MVRVIFDPTVIRLENYFQVGSGPRKGYFEGLPLYQRGYGWFAGAPRQRGAGLGDIFRRLWRVLQPIARGLTPVLKSAGRAVGEEGLAATARILNDVVQGGNLSQSVMNEGKEGVRNLLGRAERKLSTTTTSQSGSGRALRAFEQRENRDRLQGVARDNKRRKLSFNKVILKPDDVIGRFVRAKAIKSNNINNNKKKRSDILGVY